MNVFGSWLGDFVTPGQHKRTTTAQDTQTPSAVTTTESHQTSTSQGTPTEVEQTGSDDPVYYWMLQRLSQTNQIITRPQIPSTHQIVSSSYRTTTYSQISQKTVVAAYQENTSLPKVVGQSVAQSISPQLKVVKINLAWLTLLLPLIGGGYGYAKWRKRI